MTNEELAVRIQRGERELMPELWGQVERFVRYMADKHLRKLPDGRAVEFDDLYQSGYLAVADAVERFDESQGMAFIGYLAMRLKTAFAEATGCRSKRQQRDPIHYAASLDAPLGDDPDGCVLGDLVADPHDQYEEAERRIYLEQLHGELEKVLAKLPKKQETILRRYFYKGETLRTIGDDLQITQERVRQMEVRALRHLRQPNVSHSLRAFIEPMTPYYLHVGLRQYRSTNTSSVEEIALYRERLAEKYRKSLSV